MNKLPIILFSLLILLTPIAIADAEQYLNPGVTRDSTFSQDGTGVWTGRTPVTSTRVYTNIQSYYPLVADTDDDGENEIVILANNEIKILNYTVGTGLIEEAAIIHGNVSIGELNFSLTPALFDSDSDGIYNIISWNGSHIINTEWNGTSYETNNSVAMPYINEIPYAGNKKINYDLVIKCGQGIQFSTGNDTCFFTLQNLSGNLNYLMIIYDVDANTIITSVIETVGQNYGSHPNIHLADGDNDGYLEAYIARWNSGKRLQYVTSTDDLGTTTQLFNYDNGETVANQFTDIIVNNLDGNTGNGLEITFGYSDDSVNFDMKTYNANTGAVISTGYAPLLFFPEGKWMSSNLWETSNTEYSNFVGDVCMYIRNPTESYPGANIDTIFCVSQYAGADDKYTEITNTQNFTGLTTVHEADLFGSNDLLLNTFEVSDGIKQTLPILNNNLNIPVDYQQSGSLDIIGLSTTNIYYYDDGYTNSNYEITGIAWDTCNPVLQNELPTFTLTITDTEEDAGNCYFTETHANGTILETSTNNSITISDFTSTQATTTFNYFADATGTYTLNFYCKDQYHETYDTRIYSVQVSNTTGCYKGQGGSSIESSTTETAATEEFQSNVDTALADIGIISQSAKSMIWLILMMALAFLIFSAYQGEGIVYIIALLEVVMLVLGFTLGMIGTVPLVIVGLVTALLLTFLLLRSPGGG